MVQSDSPFTLSRRLVLSGSALAAGALVSTRVSAQTELPDWAPVTDKKPVVDISRGGRVTEIIMVVKDAEKVAKRFSDMFGPSWTFYDYRPKVLLLHSKPVTGDTLLKLAIGFCGGSYFKLVQPVSGPSSYADFLKNNGEGFYGINLGLYLDHDQMAKNFQNAGTGIEMQVDTGDGTKSTTLETVQDLGLRIEFIGGATSPTSTALTRTGSYAPAKPPIMNMDIPLIGGGKKFTQLGIVVKSGKAAMMRYAELLGITQWRLRVLPATSYQMFGRQYPEAELPSTTCEQRIAYIGDMQVELLEPVPEGPGGIHRRFLDAHWPRNGFQHLMATPRTYADRDATLAAFWKEGMTNEIEYRLSTNTSLPLGHYTGMEDQVGGFVLEY